MLPTCPSYTVCARSEWCKDGELMFLVQKYEELKETTDSQHQADKRAIILLKESKVCHWTRHSMYYIVLI